MISAGCGWLVRLRWAQLGRRRVYKVARGYGVGELRDIRPEQCDQIFERGPRGVGGAPLQVVQLVDAQALAEAFGQRDVLGLPRPFARPSRKLADPIEKR